jgi:xylan 1,4-beta-xylosidase
LQPFSDLFEEGGLHGDPYNENFTPVAGLNNVYGIPKPSYRAFQLMHWTGTKLLSVSPDFMSHPTVGVFAVGGNMTSIFIVNWNVHNLPIKTESVSIVVNNVPSNQSAVIYKIDSSHANALPTWVSMGRPFYLNPMQVETLAKATELIPETISMTSTPQGALLQVTIPPYAVYNIVITN